MWSQGGHQHQTIITMLSDALLIGLDPNGAAITSGNERPTQLETPWRLLTASIEELGRVHNWSR